MFIKRLTKFLSYSKYPFKRNWYSLFEASSNNITECFFESITDLSLRFSKKTYGICLHKTYSLVGYIGNNEVIAKINVNCELF